MQKPGYAGLCALQALTESVTGYDEMGNILGLVRKNKSSAAINDLTYHYPVAENQLTSINDAGSENITGSFTYDSNGNMVTDSKKNITITYNYLDLPDTVKQGSSKVVFTYDGLGNKLYKQLIVSGTVTSQKHYIEDAEVTATTSLAYDGKIESIAMDEGRIVNTPGGYKYEYNLQDHLGNNRVSFRIKSDGTADLTQVQNYYPFGGIMGDTTMNYSSIPENLYKYSDKEFEAELNLDSYDFGARHYDPRLGRWMTMDPLGIQSDELSPYNYVENNPMNMIDPDGMQANGNWSGVPLGNTSTGSTFATGWALGIGAGANAALNWKSMNKAFDIRNAPVSKQDFTATQKPGNANAYLPGRQAAVSQWQPGITDRFRSSNLINRTLYDITDDALVVVKSIFWPVGEVRHIDGHSATPRDKVMSFGLTALNLISLGEGGSIGVKAVVEDIATESTINLTKSTFRKRLIAATGANTGSLSHAHHIFPQKFASFFEQAGINIHDTQYGAFWKAMDHLGNAAAYNKEWKNFIRNNPNATKELILDEGRRIMQLFGQQARF